MNYKAVTNCLTNWLFIEESNRSGEVKNRNSVSVTSLLILLILLLLGSSE